MAVRTALCFLCPDKSSAANVVPLPLSNGSQDFCMMLPVASRPMDGQEVVEGFAYQAGIACSLDDVLNVIKGDGLGRRCGSVTNYIKRGRICITLLQYWRRPVICAFWENRPRISSRIFLKFRLSLFGICSEHRFNHRNSHQSRFRLAAAPVLLRLPYFHPNSNSGRSFLRVSAA